ncbi:MAG: hypothetical protein LBD88_04575, partial [Candidatus Peribacteria bacterium]|nr:hypothetical protein [Candidatus Peribacteria bacterium]
MIQNASIDEDKNNEDKKNKLTESKLRKIIKKDINVSKRQRIPSTSVALSEPEPCTDSSTESSSSEDESASSNLEDADKNIKMQEEKDIKNEDDQFWREHIFDGNKENVRSRKKKGCSHKDSSHKSQSSKISLPTAVSTVFSNESDIIIPQSTSPSSRTSTQISLAMQYALHGKAFASSEKPAFEINDNYDSSEIPFIPSEISLPQFQFSQKSNLLTTPPTSSLFDDDGTLTIPGVLASSPQETLSPSFSPS